MQWIIYRAGEFNLYEEVTLLTSFFIVSQLMKGSSAMSGDLMRKFSGWRSMPFYSIQSLPNTKMLHVTHGGFSPFVLTLCSSSIFQHRHSFN